MGTSARHRTRCQPDRCAKAVLVTVSSIPEHPGTRLGIIWEVPGKNEPGSATQSPGAISGVRPVWLLQLFPGSGQFRESGQCVFPRPTKMAGYVARSVADQDVRMQGWPT
jgi:hypothetical protein